MLCLDVLSDGVEESATSRAVGDTRWRSEQNQFSGGGAVLGWWWWLVGAGEHSQATNTAKTPPPATGERERERERMSQVGIVFNFLWQRERGGRTRVISN